MATGESGARSKNKKIEIVDLHRDFEKFFDFPNYISRFVKIFRKKGL